MGQDLPIVRNETPPINGNKYIPHLLLYHVCQELQYHQDHPAIIAMLR